MVISSIVLKQNFVVKLTLTDGQCHHTTLYTMV